MCRSQFHYLSVAIREIFHNPKTIFWTGKAMDFLFNGVDVDCTSEDFNSKTICTVMESGEIKSVTPKEGVEDVFEFALLRSVKIRNSVAFCIT